MWVSRRPYERKNLILHTMIEKDNKAEVNKEEIKMLHEFLCLAAIVGFMIYVNRQYILYEIGEKDRDFYIRSPKKYPYLAILGLVINLILTICYDYQHSFMSRDVSKVIEFFLNADASFCLTWLFSTITKSFHITASDEIEIRSFGRWQIISFKEIQKIEIKNHCYINVYGEEGFLFEISLGMDGASKFLKMVKMRGIPINASP